MSSYYNKNVLEDIDQAIKLNADFQEWFDIVKDILLNDEFQKRKLFMHHPHLSVWDHSITVSYSSFILAKYFFNADVKITAIAGLLHDFYPDAWIYNEELAKLDNGKYVEEMYRKHSLFKMHGFVHAAAAAENYVKFFPNLENDIITNSIKRHMFPLNIIPPKYKEGFIITLVDKANSCNEVLNANVIKETIKNKATKLLFSEK